MQAGLKISELVEYLLKTGGVLLSLMLSVEFEISNFGDCVT